MKVDFYKDMQFYSHVIHLVSRVSGKLNKGADHIKAFFDTFPAGTLSGAPKVRAMQLISDMEPHNRGAYGGCIGFIGLNGNLNQAIVIRTFISRATTPMSSTKATTSSVLSSRPSRLLRSYKNVEKNRNSKYE